jgi:hypothetical protein
VPAFDPVTAHIARNQTVSGLRVSWQIVPAVIEVCRPQVVHWSSSLRTGHAFVFPHRGQRKPSGQRSCRR